MTPAQLSVFKTAINAASGVVDLADEGAVAAYFNASSGGGFYWRKSISLAELNTAIDWSVFASLSVQLQNAYMAMTQSGTVDATSANIRTGFSTVFPGSGTTLATLNALTGMAKIVPTRLQALFTSNNLCTAPGLVATVSDVSAAKNA